jgi:hypothetical protein
MPLVVALLQCTRSGTVFAWISGIQMLGYTFGIKLSATNLASDPEAAYLGHAEAAQ